MVILKGRLLMIFHSKNKDKKNKNIAQLQMHLQKQPEVQKKQLRRRYNRIDVLLPTH
jgi:hypothetical protein